jgi:membrane-associated phospholipid phosphatase
MVHAQSWQSPDSDTSLAHFPVKFANDLPHLFIAENIAPFAVGTAATAFDWAVLDEQNSLAASLDIWSCHSLWDFGDFYGEGWVEGLGAVGSWSLGAFVSNLRLQEFGRDASESLVESTILVTGLKYAVGRERPDGSNNQSFPSGHSITAFCFAPVVQKYWGWGAGATAYALGTVTALARVAGYHHYLSDTIAGAALGIIIGNSVVYTPKDITVGVGPGQMELKLAFN